MIYELQVTSYLIVVKENTSYKLCHIGKQDLIGDCQIHNLCTSVELTKIGIWICESGGGDKHISSVKVKLQSDRESNAAHMSVYFFYLPKICILVKLRINTC